MWYWLLWEIFETFFFLNGHYYGLNFFLQILCIEVITAFVGGWPGEGRALVEGANSQFSEWSRAGGSASVTELSPKCWGTGCWCHSSQTTSSDRCEPSFSPLCGNPADTWIQACENKENFLLKRHRGSYLQSILQLQSPPRRTWKWQLRIYRIQQPCDQPVNSVVTLTWKLIFLWHKETSQWLWK